MNFIFSTLLLILSLPLFAQKPTQHITISPEYSQQEVANTPFDSVVISTDSTSSTPDYNQYTGMTSFSQGYEGQQETLFVQGAEGEDLLVLIDGIKVNDPSSPNGKFDLSLIDKSNIERIEILKGPQSGFYGADAFSGVMNIITKTKDVTQASLQYGAYNSYGTTLSHHQRDGGFSYGLHGNIKHSDGISALSMGTEKDGYDYKSVQIKLSQQKGSRQIKFQSEFLKKESDIDQGTIDDPNYTLDTETWRSRFSASTQLANNLYRPEFSYNYTKLNRHSLNFADSLSSSTENNIYRSEIHSLTLNHHLLWSSTINTVLGTAFNQEKMDGNTVSEKRMDSGSLYIQQEFQFNKTQLTAGLRYDNTSYNNTFVTYRVGLSHSFLGMIAQASYATAAKNPTLYQLYSSYGDLDLKEEKQNGGNISLLKKGKQGEVKINFFYYTMKNLIDFNMTTSKYYNYGEAKRRGYELNTQYTFNKLLIGANYTYTIATKKDGSYLLRRPRHQANIYLQYHYNKFQFKLKNSYLGKRNSYPTGSLPSFVKSDFELNYKMDNRLALSINWRNILNKDYQMVKGYQTTGSSIFTQLTYSY